MGDSSERSIPSIDVVVLTWDDEAEMHRAVGSALASRQAHVRVIVVDNGSDPPASVTADPRVTLHRSGSNLGVAQGRNVGAAIGHAPLVCFLDSDAVLDPDCLGRLSGAMADAGIALAAPVFAGQPAEASAGRAPGLLRKLARAVNLTDRYASAGPVAGSMWDVEVAIGACQLVRRTAFDEVGGFDERYFYGPEDIDLCLRLAGEGHRIVQVRQAICHHEPRRTSRRLLTRRGAAHAVALARHLWRHRRRRRRSKPPGAGARCPGLPSGRPRAPGRWWGRRCRLSPPRARPRGPG